MTLFLTMHLWGEKNSNTCSLCHQQTSLLSTYWTLVEQWWICNDATKDTMLPWPSFMMPSNITSLIQPQAPWVCAPSMLFPPTLQCLTWDLILFDGTMLVSYLLCGVSNVFWHSVAWGCNKEGEQVQVVPLWFPTSWLQSKFNYGGRRFTLSAQCWWIQEAVQGTELFHIIN